jgi:PAS domain S-box-containing protein
MNLNEASYNPTKLLLEGLQDGNSSLSTSSHERHQSMLNILRGYEEFVLDTSGNILSSNLEAVTITGYEEWEVIGKNISIFYPPVEQLKNRPTEDLAKAEAQGKYVYNGIRVKKRESPFYAKMKFLAIRDQDGLLKGFRVTLQDTTHRVLSNYNVREVKDEYLHIFNNPFVGIIKFSVSDFKIQMMNDKALKITSKASAKDILVTTLFEKEKDLKTLIRKITETGKVEEFEFQLRTDDGTERWCSISCKYFPIKEFAEGILVDITEKRNQAEKLEQLNADLDNFMYHASHDLRAPISSMMGLIKLLDMDESNINIADCKRMLRDRIHHLDHLLRDMVAIAYNNRTTLVTEKIDVTEIIANIIKEFRKTFENVNVEVSGEDKVPFYSDQVRIFQILRNVISNAFKYHGLSRPFVSIDFKTDETRCIIAITDNGVGIPNQAFEKIFHLFAKGGTKTSGAGLGLYIAKSMVSKLNGEISIESVVGNGTRLTISIPNRVNEVIGRT